MKKLIDIEKLGNVLSNWEFTTVWRIDYQKNETKLLMGNKFQLKEELKHQFDRKKRTQRIFFGDKWYYIFRFKYGISYVFCVDSQYQFDEDQLSVIYNSLYPFYLKELEKRNEDNLKKLLNGIKNTSKALDRNELYKQIVNNTFQVISKFKSISYWKYEYSENRFKYIVSKGNYEFEQDYFHYPNERLHLLMESKFIKVGVHESFKSENEISIFPFSVDGKVDGILVFELNKKLNTLSKEEIQLLETFSDQVSVVLHNINHYEKIDKLNKALLRRDEIHHNLSKLLIKNMGLDSIIIEMSKMINKNIIFIDFVNDKILPAKRDMARNLHSKEIFEIINSSRDQKTIPIYLNGKLHYMIYPLHREEMLMGCLIVETDRELSQVEYLVLEQGKLIILLLMIKEQQLNNFYSNQKREKFLQLVETSNQLKQKELIDELGLSAHNPYIISVISFKSYSSIIELDILMHKMISNLKRDFFNNIPMIFAHQDEIVFIYTLLNQDDYDLLIRYLKNKMKSSEFKDLQIKIGISSKYKNIYLIRKPYFESKLVVKFLNNKDTSEMMTYKDLGILGLFVHQSKEVIQNFIEEFLGELLDEKNSQLEETLVAYLQNNCNANVTAKKLHIHINTFYYRLKKIEELLDISFQNANDMLKVQLAYFLKENFVK